MTMPKTSPSSLSASLGSVVYRRGTDILSVTNDNGTCQAASNLADEPQTFASPNKQI